MEAVLAAENIPVEWMKPVEEVNFVEFDLAIVVGAFEEVDPDNESVNGSGERTCHVWEAKKVIYIETKVEKYKENGLFEKQNVAVLKGINKAITPLKSENEWREKG